MNVFTVFFLFFYFSFSTQPSSAIDLKPVFFDAHFECSIYSIFCVEIKYFEFNYFQDAVIGLLTKSCNSKRYLTVGEPIRVGIFDQHFFFYAQLKHNCTTPGDYRKIEHRFEPAPLNTPANLIFNFTLVLDNVGEYDT